MQPNQELVRGSLRGSREERHGRHRRNASPTTSSGTPPARARGGSRGASWSCSQRSARSTSSPGEPFEAGSTVCSRTTTTSWSSRGPGASGRVGPSSRTLRSSCSTSGPSLGLLARGVDRDMYGAGTYGLPALGRSALDCSWGRSSVPGIRCRAGRAEPPAPAREEMAMTTIFVTAAVVACCALCAYGISRVVRRSRERRTQRA
jgi:hypothetical protein